MKALFLSFALLCAVFTMSGFTTAEKPLVLSKYVAAKQTVKPATVSWPIVGTSFGITYTITGSGNTPWTFTYGTYGPFPFTFTGMGGTWTTGAISAGTIHQVNLGIFLNMPGYDLSFNGGI